MLKEKFVFIPVYLCSTFIQVSIVFVFVSGILIAQGRQALHVTLNSLRSNTVHASPFSLMYGELLSSNL